MTTRIALGVTEARDGELILGTGRVGAGWRAVHLSEPGYFLALVLGVHEQPRPARAYWLTDAAVRAVVARTAAERPSLDPESAGAAARPQGGAAGHARRARARGRGAAGRAGRRAAGQPSRRRAGRAGRTLAGGVLAPGRARDDRPSRQAASRPLDRRERAMRPPTARTAVRERRRRTSRWTVNVEAIERAHPARLDAHRPVARRRGRPRHAKRPHQRSPPTHTGHRPGDCHSSRAHDDRCHHVRRALSRDFAPLAVPCVHAALLDAGRRRSRPSKLNHHLR